jgi:hypothetical protein
MCVVSLLLTGVALISRCSSRALLACYTTDYDAPTPFWTTLAIAINSYITLPLILLECYTYPAPTLDRPPMRIHDAPQSWAEVLVRVYGAFCAVLWWDLFES